MYLALPAFILGAVVVNGFSRFGVNEIISFMISIPILIFAWFYLIGWLFDRWLNKRFRRIASITTT